MKKRLLILIPIILVGIGTFYYLSQKRPPIETKFAQPPAQGASRPEGNIDVEMKEPGNDALLPETKHLYQTFNNCGPATLSMVLSWYGQEISQKELGDKMRPYQVASGDNDDKTIFTDEFVDWAKKYGLEAIGRVNGDIALLKTLTANGIPVVVKTWLHIDEDIGHFRIVRGFDEAKQVIIQDDSYEGPNKNIAYYDFLSMWQPFNYAYIIVYTPKKEGLVEAILGEELDKKVAWNNSLVRAEQESKLALDNVYPIFNLSTAYYHLGEYENSIKAYEEVSERLPRRMLWYQIEPIRSYVALGNNEKAFRIIDNLLENGNRAFSELYQIKGEVYLAQGKTDEAREQFELALIYNENYQPAKDSLKLLNN